jgi:Glycosyl hydrolase catalytic core
MGRQAGRSCARDEDVGRLMARRKAGWRARLAIGLAALLLPLCAAPMASAAGTEFYGIAQGTLDAQDYAGMQAAKVHTERFLMRWRSVEPTKGSFNWTDTDNFIGQLASHGIRPLPFLWGSPSWVGNGALAQPPVGSLTDQTAWRDFLTRAVSRYGPGGTYWGAPYHSKYGASATPLPVQSWQIWNEPNLKKFFTPGAQVAQSAQKYANLVKISHDAIKAKDPKALIVLAGMPGFGDSKAWVFLDNIYAVPGIKNYFDVAALHPYARDIDEFRRELLQFRASEVNHADGATPIWLTEWGWGSGPPDQFGHNVGPTGQQTMLNKAVKLILAQRTAWNVQRMYWFLWRDPQPGSFYAHLCSICGTAGLLRYNRTPKPALATFKSFTTDTTKPTARFTSGPSGVTGDPTPTFAFAADVNNPGSTFQCHFTNQAFVPCRSPYTRGAPLPDGTHSFYIKAIDPVGNESAIISRQFVVDTTPPQTTITGGPAANGSTADRTPTFTFSSSEANSTFQCRYDGKAFVPCSGPGASDTPSAALTPGKHRFNVKAVDKAKNIDPTPAARSFTVL